MAETIREFELMHNSIGQTKEKANGGFDMGGEAVLNLLKRCPPTGVGGHQTNFKGGVTYAHR